jgi:hypothetical protein
MTLDRYIRTEAYISKKKKKTRRMKMNGDLNIDSDTGGEGQQDFICWNFISGGEYSVFKAMMASPSALYSRKPRSRPTIMLHLRKKPTE